MLIGHHFQTPPNHMCWTFNISAIYTYIYLSIYLALNLPKIFEILMELSESGTTIPSDYQHRFQFGEAEAVFGKSAEFVVHFQEKKHEKNISSHG